MYYSKTFLLLTLLLLQVVKESDGFFHGIYRRDQDPPPPPAPSAAPSSAPSMVPSKTPSVSPSATPSAVPSVAPTESPEDTTCSNDIVLLNNTEDVCNQDLMGPTKYIINTDVINCGANHGPTLYGAILDCEGAVIRGDYDVGTDVGTSRNGITMKMDSVVENCVVRNFGGRGVVMDTESGPLCKKVLYNSIIQSNKLQGIRVLGDDYIEIVAADVRNDNNQGLQIEAGANVMAKYSRFANNAIGVRTTTGSSGAIKFYESIIRNNESFGAQIQGTGSVEFNGGAITENGMDGVFRTNTAEKVYIKGVNVARNLRYGVFDNSGTTTTLYIEGSFIRNNVDGGVRVGVGQVRISCSRVVSNDGFGVQVTNPAGVLKVENSNLSRNGGINIDLNNGMAEFARVRACTGGTSDIEVAGAVTVGSFGSTTCNTFGECGFSCGDCPVDIPAWCEMEMDMDDE